MSSKLNDNERITRAPLLPWLPSRKRSLDTVDNRLRPERLPEPEIRFSLWERVTLGIDTVVEKVSYYWKLTRLGAWLLPSLVKLKWDLSMNNDKKTTILGWVKTAIITIVTIFFADKIHDITGFSTLLVGAVGGVWAAVEAVQGIFTNKQEKQP